MKKLIIIFIMLSFSVPIYADYFNGIECRQYASAIDGLELDYINMPLNVEWYKKENEKVKFGNVESNIVNYVFVNKKFYGKIFAIVGKDNVNEVLRFFKKEAEEAHNKYDGDKLLWGDFIERKDGAKLFVTSEKIIVVKRYSVYLGEVAILCRKMYEEFHGIGN